MNNTTSIERPRRIGAALAGTVALGLSALGGQTALAAPSHPAATADTETSSYAPHCDTYQMTDRLVHRYGAEGTGYYIFTASNTSHRTCTIYGYFGISIYARDGGKLLTANDDRQPKTVAGRTVPDHLITLRPGQKVTTETSVSEDPVNNEKCPMIRSFHLITPNDFRARRVFTSKETSGGFCQPIGSAIDVYPTTQG